jgi:hypothetical protein
MGASICSSNNVEKSGSDGVDRDPNTSVKNISLFDEKTKITSLIPVAHDKMPNYVLSVDERKEVTPNR